MAPLTVAAEPLVAGGRTPRVHLGETGMRRLVGALLLAIATNAVLIQTLLQEESPLKNAVRAAVLTAALAAVMLRRSLMPVWLTVMLLLSAILLVLRLNPDQLSIVFVLSLVPALWSIPERDLDRWAVRAALFSLALIFAFLFAGLTQNVVLDFRQRATFGTAGVPFFMNVVYGAGSLLILYAFKYRLRRRWVIAGVTLGVAFYFLQQTDGRGGFAALALFALLAFLMPVLMRHPAALYSMAATPALCLAASAWLAYRAGPQLNITLSYRPEKYQQFLDSLSGADIALSTTVKQTTAASQVDNSYIHLLVGGGVIIFGAFCLLFARAVLNLARLNRPLDLAFLMATAAYCVSESILLRIENVFIIYAWYLVLRYAMVAPPAGKPRLRDLDPGVDDSRRALG